MRNNLKSVDNKKTIIFSTQASSSAVAGNILKGSVEKKGCMFGAINREGLRREFFIPEHFEIIMVISLGKPSEEVVLEEIDESGDIKYWRDEKGVHHVPKRKLEDLILDI
ncbi:hypothetical protein [Clostridium grantii]|uniref:Nitroreductase family protein n=1 Tax=Clostridium grantii DSM 8605 TaxID=1121316 RepID=A0A1M5Y6F5_9CLOT|nr:hypothetical protein [Clostridium grantii]SHI07552.1 hypothetical protein SAMN02745207_04233 [Clostridium grantii DSM 8605]